LRERKKGTVHIHHAYYLVVGDDREKGSTTKKKKKKRKKKKTNGINLLQFIERETTITHSPI